MIRAKFRCMGVERRWDKTHRIEMLPVTHKETWTSHGEVEAPENLQFWKATPAGRIRATFGDTHECPFNPGDYYYVDFEADPNGRWRLQKVTQLSESLEVRFEAPWGTELLQFGNIEMTIDNGAAWDSFDGRAGTPWSVTFRFAEASDT